MSQYYRLFNTTRVPVLGGIDELMTYDASCGHVLVLRNGHMYTLQAMQQDGRCGEEGEGRTRSVLLSQQSIIFGGGCFSE